MGQNSLLENQPRARQRNWPAREARLPLTRHQNGAEGLPQRFLPVFDPEQGGRLLAIEFNPIELFLSPLTAAYRLGRESRRETEPSSVPPWEAGEAESVVRETIESWQPSSCMRVRTDEEELLRCVPCAPVERK